MLLRVFCPRLIPNLQWFQIAPGEGHGGVPWRAGDDGSRHPGWNGHQSRAEAWNPARPTGIMEGWMDSYTVYMYIILYVYVCILYTYTIYIYTHLLSLFLRNTLCTHIIICINKHILYTWNIRSRNVFPPPARWGLLDFIRVVLLLLG